MYDVVALGELLIDFAPVSADEAGHAGDFLGTFLAVAELCLFRADGVDHKQKAVENPGQVEKTLLCSTAARTPLANSRIIPMPICFPKVHCFISLSSLFQGRLSHQVISLSVLSGCDGAGSQR